MYNRQVYVNNLKTDMSYQSPVKDSQVKKIIKNFDHQKLHTIVVNKREDGSLYIIDGQHRVEALKELGIPLIEATIHEGLTVEEEAEMYYGINDRPAKSPNSKGKSSLKFGDANAVEIDEVVTRVGLKVDYDKKLKTEGYITAYAALQSIHKKHGPDLLEITLGIIKRAYGAERRNYQAFIMKGFADFVSTYEGKLDTNHLINRLADVGFEKFMQEVNKNQASFTTKKESLPFALVEIYNKRKHNKNKLDKRLLFL
ncbi:ParB/Srx family N-terminal domain-containing protein [Staphylococcus saprophyticus]|nr:ParB/Srx family N-terminal domain-containing protein [Staphylococcus saprophyticus]